jgi:diguanylate cyclase (GGDEF)-like protein
MSLPVEAHEQVNTLFRELTNARDEIRHLRESLQDVERKLQELTHLDDVTGLPNYRAFVARMVEEVSRATRYGVPLSVLLADIDQFEDYAMRLGPETGDEIIRTVARLLQSKVRAVDTVARYGTKQFGIILPHTEQEGATLLAERLCRAIEAGPWSFGELTASFGVTTVTSSNDDGKTCIAQAYRAMRHSALTGKNRVTHARASAIERVVPWGEVPAVRIMDSLGALASLELSSENGERPDSGDDSNGSRAGDKFSF